MDGGHSLGRTSVGALKGLRSAWKKSAAFFSWGRHQRLHCGGELARGPSLPLLSGILCRLRSSLALLRTSVPAGADGSTTGEDFSPGVLLFAGTSDWEDACGAADRTGDLLPRMLSIAKLASSQPDNGASTKTTMPR